MCLSPFTSTAPRTWLPHLRPGEAISATPFQLKTSVGKSIVFKFDDGSWERGRISRHRPAKGFNAEVTFPPESEVPGKMNIDLQHPLCCTPASDPIAAQPGAWGLIVKTKS